MAHYDQNYHKYSPSFLLPSLNNIYYKINLHSSCLFFTFNQSSCNENISKSMTIMRRCGCYQMLRVVLIFHFVLLEHCVNFMIKSNRLNDFGTATIKSARSNPLSILIGKNNSFFFTFFFFYCCFLDFPIFIQQQITRYTKHSLHLHHTIAPHTIISHRKTTIITMSNASINNNLYLNKYIYQQQQWQHILLNSFLQQGMHTNHHFSI